ncbi:reverse transcriptase domain-containing protein [Tanacetum coccineum]
MTGVPRHIAEHRLNIREGCLRVRQKKRGQAPKRNKAMYEEVEKLVDAGIMKEVHYHSWLSNLVMVKKHDDSWRMCVHFKDLNKACPKDGYPLPETDWKVESFCGEGTFLGYKVNADGLKVCPDKVEAVLSFSSLKCLKDVQKLNGKLASLNRFLSKSAEKSLPFFKTLKKCTKKSDFQWTAKAETKFKQMKKFIAELPMLTAPKEKEELIVYLAAAKEAISAVLMTERNGKQMPIYFVSRALQGPEINYTPMEKLILALVSAIKGKILADFIVERPEDDPQDTPMEDEEALSDPWILSTDGSSCIDGSGAGLIITNPKGVEFTYALRFRFDATNNEAEFEALIAGLRIVEQMGVKNLQANVDSRLVANQVNGTYIAKEPGMIKYLEKKLTPITSPLPFYKWGIDIAGPFPKGLGKVKFLIVAIDYFTKWIEAKPMATITGAQVKKFMWDNIVCRFGIPGEIISDNGKQFRDNPFKDWCEKLCIR